MFNFQVKVVEQCLYGDKPNVARSSVVEAVFRSDACTSSMWSGLEVWVVCGLHTSWSHHQIAYTCLFHD